MGNSKNIWIINQYCGSPYHGMNFRSYYLAKEFIQDNKVTIFSGSYSHLFKSQPKTRGIFTDEKIDGINYVWVKTPKYSGSKSIGRVLNMMIFMINLFFFNIFKIQKPDVIIVSSLSLFPVLNAYIWSKIFRIKFIFEVRDIWPLTLIELGSISKTHPLVILLGWFERLGYKKAKYVVSLLPNAKNYMIDKGMNKNKFIHIPNGINLEEAKEYQEISEKIKLMIPSNKFIVGYLGTVGIANALEYLICAADIIKDNRNIHILIVGNGGEKDKLQEYCIKNNMKNITFIGVIPKVEVQSMLKVFDICYIGWHNKALYNLGISANKIFDYMYSEKPVLHSISASNDIIDDAKCGITVKAENSNDIANGILTLYKMRKENLLEFGKNGKQYVKNMHSYEMLAKRYMDLF